MTEERPDDEPLAEEREHRLRAARVRIVRGGFSLPGWFGFAAGLFGGLTFLTAFMLGLVVVFASSLFWAAALWALWPAVFTPQATLWTFGTEPRPEYWKLFALVAILQAILKANARRT